ncbi:MFS transporter [Reticulibacter mediterranei]|uniref:MFS transporter n=1 Tax=Reticulibacter mediterranei TaxID=2778369 RepID=A0A8J3N7F3_9CHLR|nr:MFS transporter [Reticulibacter mediterranei]GHO97097.1 MFS transporter [Reticulibacter mediterranei]
MSQWQVEHYRAVFRNTSFRRFWLGFTFSAVGDAMTRIALIWFVYQSTKSAQAVGILLLCYTGPVVVGGLFAGVLLDRFNRRVVMLIDAIFRGAVVALIPLFYFSGHLAFWHIYLVAGVYGCFMMISLAGGPSLIPGLVSQSQLATANALETLSYTLSGVFGPPIAGLLIARFGAPSVMIIDVCSYITFALALARVDVKGEHEESARECEVVYRFRDAVSLVLHNRVLLSTTLMFILFNVGEGFLSVWLPLFAVQTLRGGPDLYGLLLGTLAGGEVIGSLLAGSLVFPLSLGALICLAQVLSGASLILLLLGPSIWWTEAGLALLGLFSAPLTIWAQTLRMKIIPERLRGRVFALLRTLMQSSGPLASGGAGALLLIVGIPAIIGLSAVLVGLPGVFGYAVKQLRSPAEPVQSAKLEVVERS